ncbi:MAG: DUF1311 domain-containing protein [Acetobacteraceae bacterium]|nr:DUF1311 domain-containing protein [Acetobacteraceae bacterium]
MEIVVNWLQRLLATLFISAVLTARGGYCDSAQPLSPEYEACIARANGVTAEMLRCSNDELERQTLRLSRAMRLIMDSPRISTERKQEIASGEKEWEAGRDKNCFATAQHEAGGGSLASMIARDCAVSKTADHAAELEAIARE